MTAFYKLGAEAALKSAGVSDVVGRSLRSIGQDSFSYATQRQAPYFEQGLRRTLAEEAPNSLSRIFGSTQALRQRALSAGADIAGQSSGNLDVAGLLRSYSMK